jgi:hypothetical protein
MAYTSYEKLPLYFHTGVNFNDAGLQPLAAPDESGIGVFCESLQFNHTPNLAQTRIVGVDPGADSFIIGGPPNSTLSFSAYVGTSEFKPTDYTGDIGDFGTNIRIGHHSSGILLRNAFMTSFSYTLTPYQPVLVQCDFISYTQLPAIYEYGVNNQADDLSGRYITTGLIAAVAGAQHDNVSVENPNLNDDTIDNLNFNDYGHGAYSSFEGASSSAAFGAGGVLSDISVVESIQYQYSINRIPYYGQKLTEAVKLDQSKSLSWYLRGVDVQTQEHSITIQGDNIQKLVPITGVNPGALSLVIKNANGDVCFTSTINGKLNAENVTIQGGDLARGSITITELLT